MRLTIDHLRLPAALVTGARGSVTVTFSNSGGDLPGGYLVAVYGLPSGVVEPGPLLGAVRMKSALTAGATARVTVPLRVGLDLSKVNVSILVGLAPAGNSVSILARTGIISRARVDDEAEQLRRGWLRG